MEYLKAITSSREISCEKSVGVSTVSGYKTSSEPSDVFLQKIKVKAYEVDLFLWLERDVSVSFTLKDLLKQADVLNTSPEVSEMIIELGIMISNVVADIN